jgi:hypothetical protein
VALDGLAQQRNAAGVEALLRDHLTATTTHQEAHAVIELARERGMVVSAGGSKPMVALVYEHPFVRQALALRDEAIRCILTNDAARNGRISQGVLAAALAAVRHVSDEQAAFWIRLLADEGIFRESRLALSNGGSVSVWRLSLGDPLVQQEAA